MTNKKFHHAIFYKMSYVVLKLNPPCIFKFENIELLYNTKFSRRYGIRARMSQEQKRFELVSDRQFSFRHLQFVLRVLVPLGEAQNVH